MPEIQATPRDLCIGLLVALGVLTMVRDLLALSDRLRLAAELDADPDGPARGAEEVLKREEEERDGDDGSGA